MKALEIGPIKVFGTAYDPSDLPGSSVDPLGFESGYVGLAEVLLPGFTTITDAPRCVGMLCAGLHLFQEAGNGQASSVAEEEGAIDALLRLERLWALASVLWWREHPDERDERLGVLRGITYVTLQAERIEERRLGEISPDFPFLRRQRITGAVGVYRNFLEKCGLLFPNEWRLTPDLGEALGDAYARGTRLPPAVKRSVFEGTPVQVSTLRAWGQYAHPTRALLEEEKHALRDAVLTSVHRRATLGLLRIVGQAWLQVRDGQLQACAEMLRLVQRGKTIRGVSPETYPLLKSTLSVIPVYERAYRAALLGFERVLWLTRRSPGGAATAAVLHDPTIMRLPSLLKDAAERLGAATESATALPATTREALSDACEFVCDLGQRARDPEAAVQALLERHKEIQEGKTDKGRRKAPWVIEERGAYRLTFARLGGLNKPVTEPSAIAPHDYRLWNARRFLAALEIGS